VAVIRHLESVFYHTLDAVYEDGPTPKKYTLPEGFSVSARLLKFLKAARKEHNLRVKLERAGNEKIKKAVEQAAGFSASFVDSSKALVEDTTFRGVFYKRRTSMRRFKFFIPINETALETAGFLVQPGPSYYTYCRLVFVPPETEHLLGERVVHKPMVEWFLSQTYHRLQGTP
jgi:hypothetical protein